jgi:hypothetical protein
VKSEFKIELNLSSVRFIRESMTLDRRCQDDRSQDSQLHRSPTVGLIGSEAVRNFAQLSYRGWLQASDNKGNSKIREAAGKDEKAQLARCRWQSHVQRTLP